MESHHTSKEALSRFSGRAQRLGNAPLGTMLSESIFGLAVVGKKEQGSRDRSSREENRLKMEKERRGEGGEVGSWKLEP